MQGTFKLTILTPLKTLYRGTVVKLNLKNEKGSFQVLHNHIPMISEIETNITEFQTEDGDIKRLFTSLGMVRIEKNKVTLLCESGEWSENIDFERAESAKKRAEERLNRKNESEIDIKRAEAALLRAVTRLDLRS